MQPLPGPYSSASGASSCPWPFSPGRASLPGGRRTKASKLLCPFSRRTCPATQLLSAGTTFCQLSRPWPGPSTAETVHCSHDCSCAGVQPLMELAGPHKFRCSGMSIPIASYVDCGSITDSSQGHFCANGWPSAHAINSATACRYPPPQSGTCGCPSGGSRWASLPPAA